MATNNAVNTSLAGQSGTGAFSGTVSPTLTTPIIDTIYSSTALPIAAFAAQASSTDYIKFSAGITGQSAIDVLSSNANAGLTIRYKGTAQIAILGANDNSSAPSGYIGEFVSSTIAAASHVTMVNNTATNITSISLTAGDWDVYGNINYDALNTSPSQVYAWISSTSATAPDKSLYNSFIMAGLSAPFGMNAPYIRFSIAATTTVYLTGLLIGASGNGTACGGIYARRAR